MSHDPRFCKPSEEMDPIARKMREGESENVDYAAIFRRAQPHPDFIPPEKEMDPAATSARLQSERNMGYKQANEEARRMHPNHGQRIYTPDF